MRTMFDGRPAKDADPTVMTVAKGFCSVTEADDQIKIFWSAGLNEQPVEIASLPASKFDASQSDSGWTITARPALTPVTDARAAYRAANRALSDRLVAMQAANAAQYPRPGRRAA
jgi:hypothetical protein